MANDLALSRTVADMVQEYDEKVARVDDTIKQFEKAFSDLEMNSTVSGTYIGNILPSRPWVDANKVKKNLLKSGWKAIYNKLNIEYIASSKDRKLFERTMENPPELTFDNAVATFMKYLYHKRYYILKGLAETFCDLDKSYRSHSNVKIGVNGLPKRIILSGWSRWGIGYAQEKAFDVLNALAAYRNEEMPDRNIMYQISKDAENGVPVYNGISFKVYQNGNCHMIFDKSVLLDINRALAEFYGDVLPDVTENDIPKNPGTQIAKDLQFYPTPRDVIETLLYNSGLYDNTKEIYRKTHYKVLEPSCGDGRIMDVLREYEHEVFGIEVDYNRANIARSKGHNVLVANFLEQPPKEEYDFVIMNPPFYGNHYEKHVRHAFKFLKQGGKLVSVLPATEFYDKKLLKDMNYHWNDLPVGSFSESGTNVPTGYLTIYKR